MNINRQDKYLILIKFKIKIQFVMFMRGHLWTPIDPAPVLLSGKPCSTSHVMLCWQISFAKPCICACLDEVRERSLTSLMPLTSGS